MSQLALLEDLNDSGSKVDGELCHTGFSHPHLQRGHPEMLHMIKRKFLCASSEHQDDCQADIVASSQPIVHVPNALRKMSKLQRLVTIYHLHFHLAERREQLHARRDRLYQGDVCSFIAQAFFLFIGLASVFPSRLKPPRNGSFAVSAKGFGRFSSDYSHVGSIVQFRHCNISMFTLFRCAVSARNTTYTR